MAQPYWGAIDPSIISDQTALDRQQAIAQFLRQQSLTPMGGTESVGGVAVRRSPLEGLAKMLQGYQANQADAANDLGRRQLAEKTGNAMSQAIATMLGGGGQPSGQPSGQPGMPPSGMTTGMTTGMPGMQPGMPSGGQPSGNEQQIQQLKRGAQVAYLTGNTELFNKLAGNILELTNEQKNMAAMGQDPRLMGVLGTAAARKAGIIEFQPGTTSRDLATGEERYQAKVGEGINLGPNGATEVPNYGRTAAGIAGAQAQATEGAKMIEVPLGDGRTVKMTQDQYLAMQGKTAPPQAAAAGAARNGDQNYAFNVGGRAGMVAPQLGVSADPVAQAAATAAASGEAGTVGKFHGESYSNIQKAGMEAGGTIARLDRLTGLLDGVNTGKLTPAGTELAAWAESVGFKVDPKLGNKQAADALLKEMALQLRNPAGGAGMPGAMSDADRQFLVRMTPGLANTPEGSALMIEMHRKMAQRDQEVAGLALDYRLQHGRIDEGFLKELKVFSAANPLFPQAAKAAPAKTRMRAYNPATGMIE